MKLFVLLVFGLVSSIYGAPIEIEGETDDLVVLTNMQDALKTLKPAQYFAKVGDLAGKIPGPMGKVAAGIFKAASILAYGGIPPDPVKLQLGIINDKIDGLFTALKEVKDSFKQELALESIRKEEEKLERILNSYNEYLQTEPGSEEREIRKNQLNITCVQAGYDHIARWFRNEIKHDTVNTGIMSRVEDDADLGRYMALSKRLLGNFAQATIFQTVCTSIIYEGQGKGLNATLQRDVVKSETMFKEATAKVAETGEMIDNNFWTFVKRDLPKQLENTYGMEYQDVANKLYNFLQDKYFFRDWFVTVYTDTLLLAPNPEEIIQLRSSGNQSEGLTINGSYRGVFYLTKDSNGRRITISSPPSDVKLNDKAKKCLNDLDPSFWHMPDCNLVFDEFINCYGKDWKQSLHGMDCLTVSGFKGTLPYAGRSEGVAVREVHHPPLRNFNMFMYLVA